MYQGKFERQPRRRAKSHRSRLVLTVLSAALLLTLVIGGTLAYLTDDSTPIVNKFTPSHVSCEVTESFNGTVKSNVNVKNTSDIAAYLRVKLVTYRANDSGQHIGGTAMVPTFTPGTDWFEANGYYYYSKPVAPGGTPETPLIGTSGITLVSYSDVDGGKQVIEVMAEAIQSVPDSAVEAAWTGVQVVNGNLTGGNA